MSSYAVVSQLSCEKMFGKKKACKYLVRLIKIVQSVIATLVKTSKGKCTHLIFSDAAI